MAQDERETAVTSRTQPLVYTLPRDAGVIPEFLAPALARISGDSTDTQLLIITDDAETAATLAEAAETLAADGGARILAVTGVRRAARLLRAAPQVAVAGAAGDLLTLVRESALKLEAVRALVIAWADDILASGGGEAMEAVLAEMPKDGGARALVAERVTPEIEGLIERYLRRARRVGGELVGDAETPVALRYVTTARGARPAALRRLLDELDPPSAIVIARTDDGEREARTALRSLGYADESIVRVSRGEVEENVALVVLYDLPSTASELATVTAAAPAQIVALVQPRQIDALRRLAGGGDVAPQQVSPAARRARSQAEQLRAELRAELAGSPLSREVLAIEPLLAEFDGTEVAAAALRLLEKVRARAQHAPVVERVAAPAPQSERAEQPERAPRTDRPERSTREERPERAPREPRATPGGGGRTRIWVGVGSRDGAGPGDLVGAIAGESGIPSDLIGKIDVREGYSLVEIDKAVADQVVEKITGATIKGRSIIARVDKGPPAGGSDRPRRPAAGGDHSSDDRRPGTRSPGPRKSFSRDDRPSGPRKPFSRDDRPSGSRKPFARGGKPGGGGGPRRDDDRGFRDRSARGEGEHDGRTPRAQSERGEWAARGERVRNARRPPRGKE